MRGNAVLGASSEGQYAGLKDLANTRLPQRVGTGEDLPAERRSSPERGGKEYRSGLPMSRLRVLDREGEPEPPMPTVILRCFKKTGTKLYFNVDS